MDWKKRLGEIKPTLPVKPSEKLKSRVEDTDKESSPAEEGLARLIVEDADTHLPEYFQGSEGEHTLKQIKSWLSGLIPDKKTPYLSHDAIQTIPESLKPLARYFEGRHEASRFEAMFRGHVVTKLRFAAGEPKVPTSTQTGMYLAPENRERCIFLVVGFYEGETPLLFRSFLIRNDGSVIGPPRDEVPSNS